MAKKIILGKRETLLVSEENINFPRYFEMQEGRRYLRFSQGFHAVTERELTVRSDDGGKTWTETRGPDPHMTFEFEDGTLLELGRGMYSNTYSTDLKYYGDPRVWIVGTGHSTDGGQTWVKNLFHIVFPFALDICHVEKGMHLLPDGTLLGVCVGRQEGGKNNISMLIASKDQGHTWDYRGTAGPPPSHRDRLGFGETGFAYHPPSGYMTALFRPSRVLGPLYGTHSADLGYNWSDPEIVWGERGGAPRWGGIKPRQWMVRLRNTVDHLS